jgi:hypothetical protein
LAEQATNIINNKTQNISDSSRRSVSEASAQNTALASNSKGASRIITQSVFGVIVKVGKMQRLSQTVRPQA